MPSYEYWNIKTEFQDLNPRIYGYEYVAPGRVVGPTVQNHTVIHYVESGKGTLEKNGKIYRVSAGQAFIIPQNEIATYTADEKDPWFYRFIAFDGKYSFDFAKLPPVITVDGDIFREITDTVNYKGGKIFRLTSLLYRLHAELFSDDMIRFNAYVEYVKEYIEDNYAKDIKVEELAKAVNFSRYYLIKLFKKETGQTLQQYIFSVRMTRAKQYLGEGKNVTQTAALCGFNYATHFSKMFRKYWEMSPMEYKREKRKNRRD
ncbi:MAG: AraC family transcriptional regulator [Clostridia bacterium]|nr:AraC family transcriptional regulator [Clostridia bacterium]